MNNRPTVKFHCNNCEETFGEYARNFITLFGQRRINEKPLVNFSGFSGRILRGINDSDFDSLTDEPNTRKVVFLMDAHGLSNLVGLDVLDMFSDVGYVLKDVRKWLKEGKIFKLAVLPETKAKLATWDNLLDLIGGCGLYDTWQEKIKIARPILKCRTYEEVMSANDIPAEVRRDLLEETLKISKLYAGDGYTRHPNNKSKPKYAEYVILNKPLAEFGAFALINLPLSLEDLPPDQPATL